MKLQNFMAGMVQESISSENYSFIDSKDPLYKRIACILGRLVDACIYFSPENEKYFKNIKLFLVDSDVINAAAYLGEYLNNR